MNASTTIQSTQEFRCRSANEVLEIVTRLDPDTGERVVLWEEIQAGFKNAHSIRSGKFVVPFLRGVDLKEIIPRRIVYHPGTVLDVILDDHNCGYSLSHDPNETTLSDIASSRDLCQTTPCIEPTAIYTTVTATSMQLATVTLKDSDIDNKSLVPYSPSMARSHQSSVVMPNAPSLQDVVSTQVSMQHSLDLQCIQIEGLQNKLDKAAEERAKNQEEMKEMQRRQQDTADQLVMKQEELVKKQEEMNEMQKMALDRLAIIHSHVQAVVTQTYELHEYPIPRLFIVLPKATGVFDKIKNPFANQFRLYFLCECGSHTMSENSKTQHEIHLAKHEGYDLEKPTEFFERYGSYILTLMNMIKYGITAAGLIVPPLAGLKIVEGINTTQQHMDYLKKNLSPLVDNAINFLQGVKSKNELGKEVAEDHTEFEQLEALEGADLRQLESYLKVKDKGRVLANLYRIVTSEGHVKWVCFDHYKAAYHQSAVQHLREIVEINRGTFLEEMGRIKIRIATNTQAKQFYDAMVKARGIQELGITLLWDATMSDLRSLANAISKANVVRVAVDGSYFKSSPLDVVNRNQRFNPILQATSNSRIQSLQIGGFDEFFSRISKSALVPAPRLRVFKYDAPPTSKDKDLQIAGDFLRHCSTLTILELKLQPPQLITKAISEMLGKVQTLDSVRIKHGNNLIIARITNGKICNVNLSLPQLGSLAFDDLKLIEKNYLSRLSINDLPRDQVERLAELLRGASSLKHLRIGCEYTTSLTILHSVIPTEEALRKAQALESLKIRNEKLYITVSLSNGTVKDADLGIQRFSDLIETSLKVIQKEHIVRLSIMDVQRNEVGQLANVLRGASSLKRLQIGCDYESCLAILHSVIPTEEALRMAQALESLKIGNEKLYITVSLSNGTVKDADLGIHRFSDLIETSLKVIPKEHIVRLSIMDVQRNEVGQLANVLRGASSLKRLQIGCDYESCLAILHSVIPTEEALRMAQALESLKIGNEKLYITVSLSNGTVKDADLGIHRFSDLIETSLKVIQKEHIVRLSIMDVQRNEVGQLANVLRGASSLKHLRVGCDYRTSLTVVDSVISTRETIIQDTGSSCLQTFELMKEGLVPFSTLFYGYSDHIQSYVSFQEGSNVFDMRTWIRQSNISTLEFVRRYGWSIAFYDGGFQTNVSCSDILNGFGDTRTPQLESLRIQSSVADAVVVDEIIWRSPNFKDLGLFVDLDEEDDFIGARTLLDRYATILSFLRLNDSRDYKERWEWFASSFPTRDTLPALESFILSHIYSFRLPSKCIPWIMAMVSAPPQPISPSQRIIQDVIGSQVTNLGSVARRPLTRLKRIVLDQLDLQTQDWKSVIKAIDFSELQILTFWYSNLPLEELRLLVNLIPDNALLKTLDIRHTHAKRHSDPRSLLALLDTLGRKAPSLTIKS
ncbi:hypothetical protein B0O80DRAFT_429165 [Mortierella sp. GBAus27b]|nr:hypothetical protein B0O80DRAFT_429165 [Mortierella sp. GBAus27b]